MTGTYAAAVQRLLIGRMVATTGAAVVAVGTFLPWLRSGTRQRSSYEIFSLVERFGYSRSDVVGWGLRLWPIVPLLLAGSVVLVWYPRKWATATVTIVAAVYVLVVAVAVRSASPISTISVQYGSSVALVGAILLAAGYLITLFGSVTNRQ
ncbi:MAG: hypothetical protein ACXVLM_16210 [Ilumatobacteraceae bacterium]